MKPHMPNQKLFRVHGKALQKALSSQGLVDYLNSQLTGLARDADGMARKRMQGGSVPQRDVDAHDAIKDDLLFALDAARSNAKHHRRRSDALFPRASKAFMGSELPYESTNTVRKARMDLAARVYESLRDHNLDEGLFRRAFMPAAMAAGLAAPLAGPNKAPGPRPPTLMQRVDKLLKPKPPLDNTQKAMQGIQLPKVKPDPGDTDQMVRDMAKEYGFDYDKLFGDNNVAGEKPAKPIDWEGEIADQRKLNKQAVRNVLD
ncbi:MAG: hypothetical protein VW879_11700, partial [Opitutae bacterium]